MRIQGLSLARSGHAHQCSKGVDGANRYNQHAARIRSITNVRGAKLVRVDVPI